ncbi:MAG: iron ABC transporter substrate-binding protein, partial [Muribaculaceae bacterium]|nr:iron ABC transporter substrate-binding protein [Muribaculaceae bacterium]
MSCGSRRNNTGPDSHGDIEPDSTSLIVPRYAKGFNVSYSGDMTLLDINDPENKEAERFHFALVDRTYTGD